MISTPGLSPVREPVGPALLKKGISYLHEALADYMLVNPGCTLREMAAHFGYTGPWICTVTRSDMFQAYMSERRKDVSALVHQSLPKKLEAAAHLATEKLIEKLEQTSDAELIVDIFDKVMHRSGYAPGSRPGSAPIGAGPVNVQNNFFISKDELEASRTKLVEAHIDRPRVLAPLMQMAQTVTVVEDSSEP